MTLAATFLVVLPVSATPASAAEAVSGGGSSFAYPEISQWQSEVASESPPLTVNDQVSSSQSGRDGFVQGNPADQFAASDVVFTAEDGDPQQLAQYAQAHPYTYVTETAGALAFPYDIVIDGQRWTGLELTPQDICQIFTGEVTTWNQIATSAPGDAVLAGVDQPITAVTRLDAAGESYVLSQYCIALDPTDWTTFQSYVDGPGNNLELSSNWNGDTDMALGLPVQYWPTKLLNNGGNPMPASSATNLIQDVTDPNNKFTIGYAAAAYDVGTGFPMASVENSTGQFVQPTPNSIQLALSYATRNAQGTFTLDYNPPSSSPGAAYAYNPSTYSYIIAPTSPTSVVDAGAISTLAAFLCHNTGVGQQDASRLDYAPLSAQVTAIAVANIETMPGAPPTSQCGIGGPAPNVTPGSVNGTVPTAPTGPASTAPASGGTTSGGSGSSTTGSAGSSSSSKTSGTAGSSSTTKSGSTSAGSSAGATAGSAESSASSPTTICTSTTPSTAAPGSGTTTGSSTTTATKSTSGSTSPTTAEAGTTVPATSTTSTTLCTSVGSSTGATGSTAGGAAVAVSGSAATPTAPVEVADAATSTSSPTNFQAYWYLLVGAAVCAVGVGAVGGRRRGTT